MPFVNISNCICPEVAMWRCESEAELPDSIMAQWRNLALSTDQADPVCCAPTWNLAYNEIFHPARRIFYLSTEIPGNSALVLLCEFQAPNGEIYATPVEDSWMFGQPLLGSGSADALHVALVYFAWLYKPYFPVVVLSGIREEKLETRRFFRKYCSDFHFYRYGVSVQCAASLKGGMDGWLGRRSANLRANLKKAARKAAAKGITFERFQPADEFAATEIYNRMIQVEQGSWKGIGKCGMAESPSREFYAVLLRRLAADRAGLVIFARLEDEDIGFIFGGICGDIYRGQQFSFVDDYKSFSIGNLLQLEKIRWLCELGINRYDMGPVTGPRMEYKKHWTEENREIQTWIMRKIV